MRIVYGQDCSIAFSDTGAYLLVSDNLKNNSPIVQFLVDENDYLITLDYQYYVRILHRFEDNSKIIY